MNNFFNYTKRNNEELFNSMNQENMQLNTCQNYIPIYQTFFDINNSNYNSFNLNHRFYLNLIKEPINYSIYNSEIIDSSLNEVVNNECFIKFSPLIDPCKYLAGKFNNLNLYDLPKLNNEPIANFNRPNNFAYVDSIFSFLSSVLLNKFNFIHGINFYGSYIAIKNNYKYDIKDDLDYLEDNKFFNENLNKDFKIVNMEKNDIFKYSSKKNKLYLDIKNEEIDLNLDNLDELQQVDKLICANTPSLTEENLALIYNSEPISQTKNTTSSSSCSSRTSNTLSITTEEKSMEEKSMEEDSDSETDSSNDEELFVNINRFPVCAIALEKCDNTLDYLLENDEIEDKGLTSCFFQIILTLLVYQKTLGFSHNDLHTNNIMYIETDKPYLYYFYKDRYYKVPTYNKIFKIIDFGRASYNIGKEFLISDCFGPDGDAATQFNIPPYYNEKKKRVDINYSFDLCRLGCSLLDFFIEDLDEIDNLRKESKVFKMISDWCLDDNNKNILYKKNGDERYPNFKLYKMITRTVNRWTPETEIDRDIFTPYKVSRKRIQKNAKIMNVEKLIEFFK
jgi:hypothetical protein